LLVVGQGAVVLGIPGAEAVEAVYCKDRCLLLLELLIQLPLGQVELPILELLMELPGLLAFLVL
jgi:hypothetical protein